jgi:hypothetical protein
MSSWRLEISDTQLCHQQVRIRKVLSDRAHLFGREHNFPDCPLIAEPPSIQKRAADLFSGFEKQRVHAIAQANENIVDVEMTLDAKGLDRKSYTYARQMHGHW